MTAVVPRIVQLLSKIDKILVRFSRNFWVKYVHFQRNLHVDRIVSDLNESTNSWLLNLNKILTDIVSVRR